MIIIILEYYFLQVIEKFIRTAHRRRNDGENMTYERSTFMYAIVVSIFAIGGMVGGFIGGWIANKFGRKGGLLINNLVGIAAALAMVFSKQITSYELLIIGRCLIGVNCGKLQSVPYHIRLSPSSNAKIRTYYSKNLVFSAYKVLY